MNRILNTSSGTITNPACYSNNPDYYSTNLESFSDLTTSLEHSSNGFMIDSDFQKKNVFLSVQPL